MDKKSSKVETQNRITETLKLLVAGIPTPTIVKNISGKYKITERQAYYYHNKAYEELKKVSDVERKAEYGKAVRRLEYIFANAIDQKNLSLALQTQRELSELFGLKVQLVNNEFNLLKAEEQAVKIDEILGIK